MSVDLNTLNELKELMEDDFDELITVFIADGQTQIDKLKTAIDTFNIEETRRIAHTLKGSSANLGVNVLSESCRVLEHKASEGSLEDAINDLEKIISDYDVAKKVLKDNF
ncbi:Hpt domain-containing protein [sulfur-oxidizing endosymbiont of Gigantopelta aegis]|uniref:Hpt domain-containing protein n=1 Tax=sulfur-oxidizing endosymbiont of Gigantopelta aegis TaxID=2794934 RepID=UPI0018DB6ACC|nr:Hpt domain-containing protein [sulfur-oxidizing endosymbiont of Gigantopelta aegis]